MLEMGSYHFEMLNLGYGAYLTFREFCQQAFPGITDRTLSQMVCGIDNLLLRPDDEVRKLAEQAMKFGVADIILEYTDPNEVLGKIESSSGGKKWIQALETAKEPWFSLFNWGWVHSLRPNLV